MGGMSSGHVSRETSPSRNVTMCPKGANTDMENLTNVVYAVPYMLYRIRRDNVRCAE